MQRRWVFLSDFHAPNHLPQAVALVAAFLRDYKPQIVVLGGDIVDFALASKFIRLNIGAGPATIKQECALAVSEVLEPIRKAAPKADFWLLEGNHEIRVRRMLATLKVGADDFFDPSQHLACDRLRITYVPSKAGNAILRLGPVTFMHGERYGLNPAKLQYEAYGGPCLIFGHAHKESTWRKRWGNGKDEICLGAGCLAAAPDYHDYDQWTRGFCAGWFDDQTGEFAAEQIRISGDNHSYLYSPYGEYSAKLVLGDRGTSWTADRINCVEQRCNPLEGGKSVELKLRRDGARPAGIPRKVAKGKVAKRGRGV